jgi:hypothetical protein
MHWYFRMIEAQSRIHAAHSVSRTGATMPNDSSVQVPHRRTAAEAVLQADAKASLRDARAVRAAGYSLVTFGVYMLARRSTWSAYHQAVAVNIHGGPRFTLSVAALVGVVALVAGPVAIVVGQLLLKRATAAAWRNPVTARIFSQMDVD